MSDRAAQGDAIDGRAGCAGECRGRRARAGAESAFDVGESRRAVVIVQRKTPESRFRASGLV